MRLGHVLAKAEEQNADPYIIAAIRLLLFTGARLSEILTLRWAYVDTHRRSLNLPDSKSGAKAIPLNQPALDVLESLPRLQGNPFVLVGRVDGKHLVNLQKPWRAIRKEAGLDNVRIHDLRHSFASISVGLGGTLPVIGRVLGHSQPVTTARYAHVADKVAAELVEATGALIGQAMQARAKNAEVFPDRLSMLMTARANSAPWSCREVLTSHKSTPRYSGDARAGSVMTKVFTGGFGPLFAAFSNSRHAPQCAARARVHAEISTWAHGNQNWQARNREKQRMDEKTARQEELRQRFSAFKAQPTEVAVVPVIGEQSPKAKPAPQGSTRRRDFKGERRRLNLRLPAALIDDIAVLCLASGVDKNTLCEEVLSAAVEKQLEKVRKRYSPEEWEGILRCVREGKEL